MSDASPPALVGLDWGTTSLRAYRFAADGKLLDRRARPWGIQHLPPGGYPEAFRAIVGDWTTDRPAVPVIMAGMVGSRTGWREVPYVPCPADAAALAAGLVALLACAAPRLRPAEAWVPNTHNAARQFGSLARHLYARHDLPRFLDRSWTEGDEREQGWFVFLGGGGSLRHAPGLPVAVSRALAGWFLRAPDDCPVEPALRWAEVRAAGGSASLADAVRRTRLGRDYAHPEFWAEVIRFFVANPLLDPEQVGPIVDWIQAQRFEPEIAPGQALPEAGAGPPRPGLSMRGRTVEATLRDVEAWHRRLGHAAPDTLALEWAPSGIAEHESVEGTRPEERRVWRIREITTGEGLVLEGRRMNHCVASYARSCAAGVSTIWTLECTAAGETQPRLTIQVHPASRRIGQARGRHNRAPTAAELAIVARWAAAAGLTLDVAPAG